jgi:hypothetical protein
MLHGKMSYGRASEDGGDGNHTPMIPPIITGNRSMPVRTNNPLPRITYWLAVLGMVAQDFHHLNCSLTTI